MMKDNTDMKAPRGVGMTKVSKVDLQEQFIELRAEGRSYAAIAGILHVSKPTLIAWGKDLQKDVANARTLRLDGLFEQYAVAKAKRVEVFGKRLDALFAELDTRPLSDVKTDVLLSLALKYGDMLKAEHEPLTMQGNRMPYGGFDDGAFETWPA